MTAVTDLFKKTSKKLERVIKRDGRIVDFSQEKITQAILKALQATEAGDEKLAKKLSDQAIGRLNKKFKERTIPAIEEIQDIVEEVLMNNKLFAAARAYILYRAQHD